MSWRFSAEINVQCFASYLIFFVLLVLLPHNFPSDVSSETQEILSSRPLATTDITGIKVGHQDSLCKAS